MIKTLKFNSALCLFYFIAITTMAILRLLDSFRTWRMNNGSI